MYAYCRGVRSSRQVERLCGTDVAFRVLCAQDVPDHSTIARFRADCQDAFAALFTQVLLVAAQAGLARFGTVAIDGTKIAANASLDANRGQEWLQRQVAEMIQDAEQTDAGEDVAARGSDGPEDRCLPRSVIGPAGPDGSVRRPRRSPRKRDGGPARTRSGTRRRWSVSDTGMKRLLIREQDRRPSRLKL